MPDPGPQTYESALRELTGYVEAWSEASEDTCWCFKCCPAGVHDDQPEGHREPLCELTAAALSAAQALLAPPIDIQPVRNGKQALANGWTVEHETDGELVGEDWRGGETLLVTRPDGQFVEAHEGVADAAYWWVANSLREHHEGDRLTDAEHALLVRIAEAYGVSHD